MKETNAVDEPNWVPRPDPTLLTTEQLRRELQNLRELIEARLAGMDKATELIQHAMDKIPSEIKAAVVHQQSIRDERFQRIDIQIRERDAQAELWRREGQLAVNTALAASKEAVGAALQAAKEAVGKTEIAVAKQIDQLGIQTQTETRALDNKMNEIKDRFESLVDSVRSEAAAAVAALRSEIVPQIVMERSRGDIGSGRQVGQGALVAVILGCVSALGVIVGIVVILVRLGN